MADMRRAIAKVNRAWLWNGDKFAIQIADSEKVDIFAAVVAGDVQEFARVFTLSSEMDVNMRGPGGKTVLHVAAKAEIVCFHYSN